MVVRTRIAASCHRLAPSATDERRREPDDQDGHDDRDSDASRAANAAIAE
jgi:hypothetical protein